MASPYTISTINDVAATSTENLLGNLKGRVLSAPSRVQIALNTEAVTQRVSVLIGGENVLDSARVTLQATVGVMPVLPDDNIINTLGDQGDEIIINATNSTAGALETRAIVRVTELDDAAVLRALAEIEAAGG